MNIDWLSKIVLLLICVPFVGYVVWQGVSLSREQVMSSSAPAPTETPAHAELVVRQQSAAGFAADVRLAAEPSLHYRPLPKGVVPTDPDARKAAQLANERIIELLDLSVFLGSGAKLQFHGKQQARYKEWIDHIAAANECAKKIDNWFVGNNLPTAKEASIEQAKSFEELLKEYQKVGQVADKTKAAEWEIRARLRVIDNCNSWAQSRFLAILERPLPVAVDDELSVMIRHLRTLVNEIRERAKQLKGDKLIDDPRKTAADGTEAIITQWTTRVDALKPLANHPSQLSADQIREAIRSVYELHAAKTTDEPIKKLLRQKAQQICSGAIPKKLRLDGNVIFDKRTAARGQVALIDKAGKAMEGLSDDSDGLNEFNAAGRTKDRLHYVDFGGVQRNLKDIEATPSSQAAHEFNKARSPIVLWTSDSANKLKEQFATKSDLLEGLFEFDAPAKGVEKRQGTWTRLEQLTEAIAKYSELFPIDGK